MAVASPEYPYCRRKDYKLKKKRNGSMGNVRVNILRTD